MNRLAVVLYRLGLHNPAVLLEFVSIGVIAAVADLIGDRRSRARSRPSLFCSLARRKALSVVITAALPLAIRAALLGVYPPPAPAIHDEYSTILAGDTLAQGRIANPAHPFAAHFETFQALQAPSYASFRPVGPALALALGKLVANSYWFGVWLATGAMCGAICWMLRGWMPPIWAFAGGLLAGIQIGVLSYWMNSYWGGSVAALGGAVAMGALGRMRRQLRFGSTAVLICGLILVLLSRPFEGLVFSIGIAAVLVWWMLNPRWSLRDVVISLVLPAAAGAFLLCTWTLYYNWRLTGNPRVFPYELGVQRSNIAPPFVWGGEPDPKKKYDHTWRRSFHVASELHMYRMRENIGRVPIFLSNLAHMWQFFVRPALTIPLIAGIAAAFALPNMRALVLPALFTIAAMPLANWYNAHYIAAITGIVYSLVAQGLRRLWLYRDGRGRAGGRKFVLAVPCACVMTLGLSIGLELSGKSFGDGLEGWAGNKAQMRGREELNNDLRTRPGRDLVFVRYAASHDFEREWVQNEANIDGADVVWARELDAASNAALMSYFADRTVWLLEPDLHPIRLARYAHDQAVTTAASPKR